MQDTFSLSVFYFLTAPVRNAIERKSYVCKSSEKGMFP